MEMENLPGGSVIRAGLEDLAAGRETEASLLVMIGAPRLRRLGFGIPAGSPPFVEHRLYERLRAFHADAAHSRYNALLRVLVSFERAAECVELAEVGRIQAFMREIGKAAREETRVYFTGGTSAVLLGWRGRTIDVDVHFAPERDELLRALPGLKETLQINVELVSPADFIPELPGWEDRSVFVAREGRASFYHYDFHAQALAKIERGHAAHLADVAEMLRRGLITAARLREMFEAIRPSLYRYPAIDPDSFRRALDEVLGGA